MMAGSPELFFVNSSILAGFFYNLLIRCSFFSYQSKKILPNIRFYDKTCFTFGFVTFKIPCVFL